MIQLGVYDFCFNKIIFQKVTSTSYLIQEWVGTNGGAYASEVPTNTFVFTDLFNAHHAFQDKVRVIMSKTPAAASSAFINSANLLAD